MRRGRILSRAAALALSAAVLLFPAAVCAEDHAAYNACNACNTCREETLSSASLESKAQDIENLKDALRKGFDSFKGEIKISGNIKEDDLLYAFSDVLKDYKYIYVSGPSQYSYSSPDNTVKSVFVSYAVDKNTYEKNKNEWNSKIKKILKGVNSKWTDLQKCAYIHDYIALGCVYKTGTKYEHSAYGALIKGDASCEGYSKAYMMLLEALGIECTYVSSESMVHMWNMVKLDGKWYHVDLTHDDPTSSGETQFAINNGQAYHKHFMKSDSGLKDHKGWKSRYKADSKKYDKLSWESSTTPFAISGKNLIYSNQKGVISCYNTSDGTVKKLLTVTDEWKKTIDSSSYYSFNEKLVGVAAEGNTLYYNTPNSVMKYDLKSGKKSKVASVKGNDPLTGVTVKNGSVYGYYMGAKENAQPKLVKKAEKSGK